MAITKHDIWHAADGLDAEGIRPTLQAVRKRLGKGSFTTISDAMSEWKGNREVAAAPPQEPPPGVVMEQLTETGLAIWATALDAANKRLEDERQQLETEREAIQSRMAEATALADSLSTENEVLQEKLNGYDTLQREKDRLSDQLAEQKRRTADELNRCMAKVTRRDSEAMEARNDAKEANERAANLEGQVSALKAQLSALTKAVKAKVGKSGGAE